MDRKIKKAAVITLGCKINSYESEAIKEQLADAMIDVVPFADTADLFIINTCSVTSSTDAESRQVIRRIRRANPECVIAVTGCYAQLKPEEIKSVEGVDFVFGNVQKGNIVRLILSAIAGKGGDSGIVTTDIMRETSFHDLTLKNPPDRDRAFLKIQDGCDSFCAYCIVPYARGTSRSMERESVIAAINRLVEAGIKEIVLSGVHIGKYGRDLHPTTNLNGLIRRIESETGLLRLRISSLEPNEIDDEFIKIASKSKILCNHLHIPLQSGDDEILKNMNRPYTTSYFDALVRRLKSAIEDITIGADVIVGFPGESDEHFDNTFSFIDSSMIDYLHVFPYSKRDGTPATGMKGHVREPVKKERARILRELGGRSRAIAYENMIGKSVRVLFERKPNNNGKLFGITTNYMNACTKTYDESMFNAEFKYLVREVMLYKDKPLIVL